MTGPADGREHIDPIKVDTDRRMVVLCGDGRYRAYVGGESGRALEGSWATAAEAEAALIAATAVRRRRGPVVTGPKYLNVHGATDRRMSSPRRSNLRRGREDVWVGHRQGSVFRICQTKCPKPHFHGQAVDRAAGRAAARPSSSWRTRESTTRLHRGAPADLDELMSVLQRGDRLGVSELWPLGRSLGVRRGRARPDLREHPRALLRAKSSGSSRETPTEAEIQLHEHPRAQAEPLPCISARIWSVPYQRLRAVRGARRRRGRGGERMTEALVPVVEAPADDAVAVEEPMLGVAARELGRPGSAGDDRRRRCGGGGEVSGVLRGADRGTRGRGRRTRGRRGSFSGGAKPAASGSKRSRRSTSRPTSGPTPGRLPR